MSKPLETPTSKAGAYLLALICLLALSWILYSAVRYEKASIGQTEIRYDKFSRVIYLRKFHDPKAEWVPTDDKNIMEAKIRLAKKELDEALEETSRKMPRKPSMDISPNRKSRH